MAMILGYISDQINELRTRTDNNKICIYQHKPILTTLACSYLLKDLQYQKEHQIVALFTVEKEQSIEFCPGLIICLVNADHTRPKFDPVIDLDQRRIKPRTHS